MPLKDNAECHKRLMLNSSWKKNHHITLSKILVNQNYRCKKCKKLLKEESNHRYGLTIQHLSTPRNFNDIEIWCRSCNSRDGGQKLKGYKMANETKIKLRISHLGKKYNG